MSECASCRLRQDCHLFCGFACLVSHASVAMTRRLCTVIDHASGPDAHNSVKKLATAENADDDMRHVDTQHLRSGCLRDARRALRHDSQGYPAWSQQNQPNLLRLELPVHAPVVQVVPQFPIANAELELLHTGTLAEVINLNRHAIAHQDCWTPDCRPGPAMQPLCCTRHAARPTVG